MADHAPQPEAEPEAAIACYERWSGMIVVVHDVGRALAPYLAADRAWHARPWCQAVKRDGDGARRCLRWEIDLLRPAIAQRPEGAVRQCHAGLVELTVPVVRRDRLELVLFAGQRSRGSDLRPERDELVTSTLARSRPLPPLGAAEAAHALEGLRQLGARLRQWLDEHAVAPPSADRPDAVGRALAIRRFVAYEHHTPIGLADLARSLGLSVHRAAHVVREATDRTFVALVTEARLRSACALLRHTELPIPDVAKQSGFGDVDHFHRVFRRLMKTTPARLRREAGGP